MANLKIPRQPGKASVHEHVWTGGLFNNSQSRICSEYPPGVTCRASAMVLKAKRSRSCPPEKLQLAEEAGPAQELNCSRPAGPRVYAVHPGHGCGNENAAWKQWAWFPLRDHLVFLCSYLYNSNPYLLGVCYSRLYLDLFNLFHSFFFPENAISIAIVHFWGQRSLEWLGPKFSERQVEHS